MSQPGGPLNTQLSTRGKNRFTNGIDWGAAHSFDTEQMIRYVYFKDEGDGGIEAFANVITGPEVVSGNSTGRIVAAAVGQPGAADGLSGGSPGLFVAGYGLGWNGSNWDRVRGNDAVWASVSGASGATIKADPGAGNKWRIVTMLLTVDTAGLVTISDGATLLKMYMAIGVPVFADYRPIGRLQPTAHAAITMTNAGGGNVAADVVTAGKN